MHESNNVFYISAIVVKSGSKANGISIILLQLKISLQLKCFFVFAFIVYFSRLPFFAGGKNKWSFSTPLPHFLAFSFSFFVLYPTFFFALIFQHKQKNRFSWTHPPTPHTTVHTIRSHTCSKEDKEILYWLFIVHETHIARVCLPLSRPNISMPYKNAWNNILLVKPKLWKCVQSGSIVLFSFEKLCLYFIFLAVYTANRKKRTIRNYRTHLPLPVLSWRYFSRKFELVERYLARCLKVVAISVSSTSTWSFFPPNRIPELLWKEREFRWIILFYCYTRYYKVHSRFPTKLLSISEILNSFLKWNHILPNVQ